VTAPVEVLPRDEHNATLVSNVHPPDWKNPKPASRYHLVVIGAGTAGLVTAAGAAGLGARVALIERSLMGGDCLNVGCVPSKCVIRSSRVVGDLARAAELGVEPSGAASVNFPAVMERMRRIRSRISFHDSALRFRDELGVDVFLGEARFVSSDSVEVDRQQLRFRKAVIATGARAAEPPIEGLAKAGFLTNETVFSLTQRPHRLAVVGGGPIGCELAQAFHRLGSQVTLIEMGAQFLGREDPDAAATLLEAFRRDGIDVRLGTALERVSVQDGERHLFLTQEGRHEELIADEILVGIGRKPNVEGLNLEGVGVEFDAAKGVQVDDRLRTANRRIFAAGDICMQTRFTHAADFAARLVIQNALFLGRRKLSSLIIPWCTYTDPEVAHVGVGERQAQAQALAVDVYTRRLAQVDRALADGEEEGFVKVLTRKGSDRILGATIVARHAGEMIGEITLAMNAGVGLSRLANVIHPYPTQAEAIRQIGDLYNRTRLTPWAKRMLGGWLSLTS
jgi:pyruvate/2-oxoglutarate dehydrogenase complex dihydrolipoamide dehydrogenase (E3) component